MLQGDDPRLVLARNALPLEEALPIRAERADAAFHAVGGDEQRIPPEELGNLPFVVGQVVVEGDARRHTRFLELGDQQGQPVDKTHQVGAAGVEAADDGELADEQKVVLLRLRPVDDAHPLALVTAVLRVGGRDGDALLKQVIEFPVGRDQSHGRTVEGQLVHGRSNGRGRQRRVERDERSAQPIHQHHLAFGFAPQRAAGAEPLVQRRERLPAERSKEADGRLLDKLFFSVGVTHGSSCGVIAGSIADKLPINFR